MLVAMPSFTSGRRMRSGTGMWLLLAIVVAIAGAVGVLIVLAGALPGP